MIRGTLHVEGRRDPIVVEIAVEDDGLVARGEGEEARIAWGELRLTNGGFEGNTLFCRDASHRVTIASTEPALLAAIGARADVPSLAGELAKVTAQRKAHVRQGRAGIALAGIVVLSMVVSVLIVFVMAPRMLAAGVDGVPIRVDRELGDAAAEANDEGPAVDDPRVVGLVTGIVERLAPNAAVSGFEFRVRVVRSDAVNAYALPGGQIVVLTGLLEAATRAEQVAGVLAHEMAHVTLRHGIRNVAHQAGLMLAVSLLLGDQSGWVELATNAAMVAETNDYSRDQEAAADEEGVRMLVLAGIDPNGLAELFEILQREPGAEVPAWLSTHPELASRIDHVHAMVRAADDVRFEALDPEAWASAKAALGAP
ncbi:MAG: M48 family metallopeptidase [Sandaracinaceae bacterium]